MTIKTPRCEESTLRTKTRLPFSETWSDKGGGGRGLVFRRLWSIHKEMPVVSLAWAGGFRFVLEILIPQWTD